MLTKVLTCPGFKHESNPIAKEKIAYRKALDEVGLHIFVMMAAAVVATGTRCCNESPLLTQVRASALAEGVCSLARIAYVTMKILGPVSPEKKDN